jgi:hypothetical protein
VKIKVVHDECGRESLIQQILESQGHCPWDGKPFSNDYTANLTEALETAENAGNVLENALEEVVGMRPNFVIDRDSVLAFLEEQIERLRRRGEPAGLNQARAVRR